MRDRDVNDKETEETVTITKKEYDALVEKSRTLNALRCAGVDNWEGWDYAMESLNQDDTR